MGKSHRHRRSPSSSESSESDSNDSSKRNRSKSSSCQSRSWHKRSKHSRNSRSRSPGRKKSDKHSKKKHKKHTSKRSSSSDSDSSPERGSSNMDVLQRVERERLRLMEQKRREAEERRKEKIQMKEVETPQEKRLRRLMKKEIKERKRKERMGWDNEYLHYTNTDNPFGDGNLLETFVWKKKLDKEGLANIDKDDLERRNREKQEESRMELEKVKKRRLERQKERTMRDDEMQLLQRQKEAAQFKEWERQEDKFHLDQARLRSKIRIEDGRAKPIDLLAKYISAEEDVDAVEMHEPYTYLTGLSSRDMEDLLEDIKVYKELERGYNLDFWNDMTIIVEEELNQLRKTDSEMCMGERREGIHTAVAQDVSSVFKNKTYLQLQQLHQQISKRLSERHEGTDVSYWESLLQQLNAHMARARLRKRHEDNLKKKLELLKAEAGMAEQERKAMEVKQEEVEVKEEPLDEIEENEPQPETSTARRNSSDEEEDEGEGGSEQDSEDEGTSGEEKKEKKKVEEDILSVSLRDYENGRYTPPLVQMEELELGTIVIPEDDDEKQLQLARLHVLGTGRKVENVLTAEEKALQHEAKKGMTDDEAQFSVEAPLKEHSYLWSDKYRPRKPRYFNRVHTGFEWNKYNQTHYDMDNPPPKIVQGYKFNIFYPDLIDRSTTPEYHLTPIEDNKDFAILRFHAGPPYEDIAFKIVNREWEYSYKRGFRCQFHNNIFQLWFHFKRYRYRR